MRKIILSLLVAFSTLSIYAQNYYTAKTHGIVFHGRGGYSQFRNRMPDTQSLGGAGVDLGIGYEYGTYSAGFLMQTGFSASFLSSSTFYLEELTDSKQMYDTEGIEHTAYFTFDDIREFDSYVTVNYNLLFGYQGRKGGYILVGPKVGYSLLGLGKTTTSVTQDSRYDGLIGGDGDGLLSDIPNHDIGTVERVHKQPIHKNLHAALSAEFGFSFSKRKEFDFEEEGYVPNKRRAEHTTFRFGFFCEVGGFINTHGADNSSLIVNNGTNGRYQPTIGNYLYREHTPFLLTIGGGIKLTYVIQYSPAVCVRCNYE